MNDLFSSSFTDSFNLWKSTRFTDNIFLKLKKLQTIFTKNAGFVYIAVAVFEKSF